MMPTSPIPAGSGLSHGLYGGIPALLIGTPHANAAISLFGGQLLSYTPAGFGDLLWLSSALKPRPAPIRGGIPLCWPYFGRQGQSADAPAHGHARTAMWRLDHVRSDDDGTLEIALSPEAMPITGLSLRQVLRIGHELTQTLVSTNHGNVPATISQALHAYFQVGEVERVAVEGLDESDYADQLDGGRTHRQHGDWRLREARDPGRCDRIYANAGNRFILHDPALRRRIVLTTAGSHSLVVWNPGAEGARGFADIPAEGWRHFLCLETANAGSDTIVLESGESHALAHTLQAMAWTS